MHDMYITEIYRVSRGYFLSLRVYLHSLLHRELRKKIQDKKVRYGRSRSFKVIEFVPIEITVCDFV